MTPKFIKGTRIFKGYRPSMVEEYAYNKEELAKLHASQEDSELIFNVDEISSFEHDKFRPGKSVIHLRKPPFYEENYFLICDSEALEDITTYLK